VISSLGRSGDVRRVLSAGQRRTADLLAVHALMRPPIVQDVGAGLVATDPAAVRVTTVAAKRVGNAVQRNRAKRMLREAARAVVWMPGHDVVLVARSATVTAPLEQLTAELVRLGRALGVVAAATSGASLTR
jgi:ribonuclease P protein component